MPSIFASTCWPTRFLPKWLAVFFAALALGTVLGFVNHRQPKPPAPKPAPPIKNVRLYLRAVARYPDGQEVPVPAQLWTAGSGDKAIRGSYQGKLSTSPKDLTPISRPPGSRLWLIFNWQGREVPLLIDNWPQTTIPETAYFDSNQPDPNPVKHGTAH